MSKITKYYLKWWPDCTIKIRCLQNLKLLKPLCTPFSRLWTCIRFKARSTTGLSTFCTSFKTTGLQFSIPGNGDSRERCLPLGVVLSDCNLRSGSSGPALHTGKNTPGITGGCGQTKNVTEPLLQFPGQTVAIPTDHELRGRFSSKGARPWLDQCTL